MTKNKLLDIIDLVTLTNPSIKPLNDAQMAAYLTVLEPVDDEMVDSIAIMFARKKLYAFPSAGEIYEACLGPVRVSPKLSESERLWFKTLQNVRDQNAPAHDEWSKIRRALEMSCSCCAEIIEADEYTLNRIKRDFIRCLESEM